MRTLRPCLAVDEAATVIAAWNKGCHSALDAGYKCKENLMDESKTKNKNQKMKDWVATSRPKALAMAV